MNWYTEEERRAAFYKERRRKEIAKEYMRQARHESLCWYILAGVLTCGLAAVVML